MANDVTNERLWILDTAAVIKTVGNEVTVRKLVYTPAAIDNAVVIKEYLPDGTLGIAMKIKANHTDVNLVTLDWGPEGRRLNGFELTSISAGTLDVYIGVN